MAKFILLKKVLLTTTVRIYVHISKFYFLPFRPTYLLFLKQNYKTYNMYTFVGFVHWVIFFLNNHNKKFEKFQLLTIKLRLNRIISIYIIIFFPLIFWLILNKSYYTPIWYIWYYKLIVIVTRLDIIIFIFFN